MKFKSCKPVGAILVIAFAAFSLMLCGAKAKADVSILSLARFLSPGPLTKSHAQQEKLKDCYACHTLTRGLDDSLCLACHKSVKAKLLARDGYHGKLQGNCRECHTEHKGLDTDIINFDTRTFNHRLANYALTGKHAEIDCNKCHRKQEREDGGVTRFIGVKSGACTDCHKNPHPAALGEDCQRCHSTAGWSGRALLYSHSRDSKFKLLGKHQETACDKCHRKSVQETQFLLPEPACLSCHSDEHNGQLSKNCEECHTEFGWAGGNLKFSHAQNSKFKLAGKHQELSCEKCHKLPQPNAKLAKAKFTNIETDCIQCHSDEHRGQFSKQCEKCHTEFGWKDFLLTFDHNKQSSFKLDATHTTVPCADCHKDKRYKPLNSNCIDCHGEYEQIMAGTFTGNIVASKADPHWNRIRCNQCHDAEAARQRATLYQDKCVGCHNFRYGTLLLDWMKDWYRSRYEVRELLRQAEEKGAISASEFQQISQRLKEAEKIGAHNFQAASFEWKALKADLDREMSRSLAKDSLSDKTRRIPGDTSRK